MNGNCNEWDKEFFQLTFHDKREEQIKESLSLTGLYAHETVPKENLYWFLITNAEINTAEDAEKQIKNYVHQ